MRAAGINAFASPVTRMELPEPRALSDDEVLISLAAAGVGNWDDILRAGQWDVGRQPPLALGVEGAGTIVKVGRGVTNLAVGDAVMTHAVPLREQGFWAEQVIAAASFVVSKPGQVTWAEAAAFPVPALVAEQALTDTLDVQEGESLLVNGAGSTTGGLVVQLAVARGLGVIATAGPSSAERVRDFGADTVIDYRDPTWPAQVRARHGGAGVAVAVNAVRGGAMAALDAVADGGRLATITGDPPTPERGVQVSDVYVRPDGRQLAALAQLLAVGRLSVLVAATHPLGQAAEALGAAVSGRAGGPVVLTMPPAVH
jgi:NADPH:quinone reductase-like Zn-dependent oxidoreductase